MVTEVQVLILRRLVAEGKSVNQAARICGMSAKTARKWLRGGALPKKRPFRDWRTRPDPFAEVWEEVVEDLRQHPDLPATERFRKLCERYPGRFQAGQLRTFQRRVSLWAAIEGPEKEIVFPQQFRGGEFSQSDVTSMNELGVTIQGEAFPHRYFHFVLPFSNWETGQICFSENFETLSSCLQDAWWELGGVAAVHQCDNTWAVVFVTKTGQRKVRPRYKMLLEHYGCKWRFTRTYSPHQNGDVERSHGSFKQEVQYALRRRGSRDFQTVEKYQDFLREIQRLRQERVREKFQQERHLLKGLPAERVQFNTIQRVRVSRHSTIQVRGNVYSVPSTLIGRSLTVELFPDELVIYLQGREILRRKRLMGRSQQDIDWRHLIRQLVCKPGAFARYRYREALFPSMLWRKLYEALRSADSRRCDLEYLRILLLASEGLQGRVESVVTDLLDRGDVPGFWTVRQMVVPKETRAPAVRIRKVDLHRYDRIYQNPEVCNGKSGDGASSTSPSELS